MSGDRDNRLAAMRRAFRERLDADLAVLRQLSADPSRRDELLACVHRLAGSAGTFGAPEISEAAERAEELLRRGESVEAGEALANLTAALDNELDRELDRDLNRGPLQR